jgi:6,7-dimethyl-8-ribityllumazine synthase
MTVFEGKFTQTEPFRFAIVIGRFNDLITGKLLEGCQDCLKRHGVDVSLDGTQVDYTWVPGSFEVPLVARQLALTNRYDAVIASAGFQTGIPVVFGILTADSMQQALERAGIKSNKGWDYAMNALEMASLMHQIRIELGSETYEKNATGTAALPASFKSAMAANLSHSSEAETPST